MRQALLTLLLTIILTSLRSQDRPGNFILSGTISGMNGKYIYFSYRGLGMDRLWDSIIVRRNAFVIKGTISEPAKALLTDLKFNRLSTVNTHVSSPLFIEPGSMTIRVTGGNFRTAKLRGSATQDDYILLQNKKEQLNNSLQPYIILRDKLDSQFIANSASGTNQDVLSNLLTRISRLNTKIQSSTEITIVKDFFKSHPNSYITLYEIVENVRHFSLEEFLMYFNRMRPELQKSNYGKQLKAVIDKLKKGSPGSVASNFEAITLKGDSINLSGFKGKYLLLDFWGSWCKPCREGNPELIRLYNIYHQKGIEFIGIASDNKTQDKWREAIIHDGIGIWTQVLEGEIGELYHIQSYPIKILIDRAGMIIGRYGEGGEPHEKLAPMLERLFNK